MNLTRRVTSLPFTCEMGSDELCATLALSAESTMNSRLAGTMFVDFVPYADGAAGHAARKMSAVAQSTDPDYIIDGTVRRCGRQIRLDIDFVQRSDGRLRWSQEVMVEADQPEDAIQWITQDVCRRVSRAIAADMHLASPAAERRAPPSPERSLAARPAAAQFAGIPA